MAYSLSTSGPFDPAPLIVVAQFITLLADRAGSEDKPSSATLAKSIRLIETLTAHYGAEAAQALAAYLSALHEGIHLSKAITATLASGQPKSPEDDANLRDACQTTAELFFRAGDVLPVLAKTPAICTGTLLSLIPSELVARIIRAGLEAEAEEIICQLTCVTAPDASDE